MLVQNLSASEARDHPIQKCVATPVSVIRCRQVDKLLQGGGERGFAASWELLWPCFHPAVSESQPGGAKPSTRERLLAVKSIPVEQSYPQTSPSSRVPGEPCTHSATSLAIPVLCSRMDEASSGCSLCRALGGISVQQLQSPVSHKLRLALQWLWLCYAAQHRDLALSL